MKNCKLYIVPFLSLVLSLAFSFHSFAAGEGCERTSDEVAAAEEEFYNLLETVSPALLINGVEVPLVVDDMSLFALQDVEPVRVTYEVIQGGYPGGTNGTEGNVWIPETSNSSLTLPSNGPNWYQIGIIKFFLPQEFLLSSGDTIDISLILLTKNIEIHDNNEYGTDNMSFYPYDSVTGVSGQQNVCSSAEIGGAVATFSWIDCPISFDTNCLEFRFNFYFNANDISFIPTDVEIDSDSLAQEDTLNEVKEILESTRDGYDSSAGDSLNSNVSDSFSQVEIAEDLLRDEAFTDLDSYDIGGQNIEAYGSYFIEALIYISTLLQNIFVASSSFNILISIGFTVTICAMLIGLFKFYK